MNLCVFLLIEIPLAHIVHGHMCVHRTGAKQQQQQQRLMPACHTHSQHMSQWRTSSPTTYITSNATRNE